MQICGIRWVWNFLAIELFEGENNNQWQLRRAASWWV